MARVNGYGYVVCRITRHSWRFRGLVRDGDEVQAIFECRECPTRRTDWLTSRGELSARRYEYPDGYRIEGDRPTIVDFRRALMRREPIRG